ncbi:hypothetical protein KIH27_03965 [Mycobacterium sp. M1]|uniref:Integral membrane protein n=2 Tax=Mycolicibacter acidiphilus TaxID=2835306 RepID=A0ABS5REM9_9MYCO|nr:hypothetical protein [Mycolicibacter acidiphilus]
MVAAASGGASGPAALSALLAAGAVLAGWRLRSLATLAVLLTAITLALADPPAVSAAVAGLAAVAYLLLRHGAVVTAPTVIAALGFGVVGLVATGVPLRVPWLPLAAAPAVFGCYLLAVRPFLSVPDGRH